MEIGDLAKYLSRTILIVDMDNTWAYGLELGETQIGKYRRKALKPFQSREDVKNGSR